MGIRSTKTATALALTVVLLSAWTSPGPTQEPALVCVRLAAPDGGFRLAGDGEYTGTGAESRLEVPAGDWVLHFGPSRGRKPASLPLSLPAGARVSVAAGRWADLAPESGEPPFEAPSTETLDGWDATGSAGKSWRAAGGLLEHSPAPVEDGSPGANALLTGATDWRDYWFEAVAHLAGAGPSGLLIRHTGQGDHYAVTLDPAADRVKLERVVGGARLVLGEGAVSLDEDGVHLVACQGDGFRLQVWIDDVVVIQVLDGAHDRGRIGLFAAPVARVAFEEPRVLPPVRPAPVVATVSAGGECTVRAAAPGAVGLDAWVHFAVDETWPPGLRDEHGLGPFLVTEGRRDWFLPGGRLMAGAAGIPLRDGGTFSASFRWPRTPALHGQVVLVGTWLASPDGAEVRESLPRTRVVF